MSALEIKIHPVANILPKMDDKTFEQILEDIKTNGLREQIRYVADESGKVAEVFDGRHRLKMLKKLGIDPWEAKTRDGKPAMREERLRKDDSLPHLVASLNLHRRHLTVSQRATVAADLEPMFAKEAKQRQKDKPFAKEAKADAEKNGKAEDNGKAAPSTGKAKAGKAKAGKTVIRGTSRDQAAKAVGGVSGRNVQDAKKLRKEAPDLYEKVKEGDMTTTSAIAELKRRGRKAVAEEAAANAPEPTPEIGEIIHGDAAAEMGKIKDGAVNLVIADPPYNEGTEYPGKSKKADSMTPDEYKRFTATWIKHAARVLAPNGSMFIIIAKRHGAHVFDALLAASMHLRAWITWYETFGQNMQENFNRTSRFIFYAVKNPKAFIFNADAIRRRSKRQDLGDKRANPEGKLWDDVWIIPRIVGNAKEKVDGIPNQLPLALVQPIVELASNAGDKVLDPFCGSGTTICAATTAESGPRLCATIDDSEQAVAIAKDRWQGVLAKAGMLTGKKSAKKKKTAKK